MLAASGTTCTFVLAANGPLKWQGNLPNKQHNSVGSPAMSPGRDSEPGRLRSAAIVGATALAIACAAAAGGTQRRRQLRVTAGTAQRAHGRTDTVVGKIPVLGNSTAVPFLQVPAALTNNPLDTSFPGDFGFDPVGFSLAKGSPLQEIEEYLADVWQNSGLPAFEKLRWYREAELMHGRVAMLASMNILIGELGEFVLPDQVVDTGGKLQFLQVMALFEAYRGYRLFVNSDKLAGDLGLGMGPGEAMAVSMTREDLAAKQYRELQNGRLAMLGFTAMAVQYEYNSYYVIPNDTLKHFKDTVGAAMLPENAPVNSVLAAVGTLLALDGIRRLSSPSIHVPRLGPNSIAQKAINPFAIQFGIQTPPVSLPAGVVAGGPAQTLPLTEEQVVQFEQDGVIMIKGAMQGWVEFLRAVTEHQIEHPHFWSLVGRMSGLYDYIQRNTWMTNDGFRDFMYYSPLGHVVAQLSRTPEVRISTDMLLVNPNKGFGWHQDNQNGPIDFPDAIRWWVAMDSCGESDFGAPEYLLGSHRNETVSNDAVFVSVDSGDLPSFTRSTKYLPEPGDLIIWNSRTIHRIVAPPGQCWVEGTQRRALGGTLAKAGAIYLNKGGASAISDLAGHAQEGGELLDSPYFPRIYPERVKDEVSLRSQGGIVGRSPKKIVDLAVNLASNMGKYISFTKVVGKKN